ncbi:hypothetical protein RRG08_019371 [Elysia crispata]|uniref:Uncharacterized protein n=1 Tax=Elysia crispata TaxID=231223 RepID=A0AAE1AVE5_9GAST|nr:hypothetical protein RRG08_019371 [Elysia crispata]
MGKVINTGKDGDVYEENIEVRVALVNVLQTPAIISIHWHVIVVLRYGLGCCPSLCNKVNPLTSCDIPELFFFSSCKY